MSGEALGKISLPDSKPTLTVCIIISLGSEGAGETPLQSMEPENVASGEIDDF